MPSDLSKPNVGFRQGALNHRGEVHVVSHHHLVQWLHLKPAAVTATVSNVNALKVPALQWAEGRLQGHTMIVLKLITISIQIITPARMYVYNNARLILESFKFDRHKVLLLAASYPDHSIRAKRHQLSIF